MLISPAFAAHGITGTGSSGGGIALLIILAVAIAAGLGATAVVACLVPGVRAARLDPMSSLRLE